MSRYTVCYIDGKKEISRRVIDASNHEEAYIQYLEIDGLRNYPIKTYSYGDQTEMLWREHGEAHKASTNEQVVKQLDSKVNQEHGINLVVEHLQFSNKILGRIEALQECQIDEIKSVKLWMRFGIFMILLQIITAKIKLGL
jgi:hypothetical protein